jgi:hypothetical protein
VAAMQRYKRRGEAKVEKQNFRRAAMKEDI